jgi:CBS domain-containing protein
MRHKPLLGFVQAKGPCTAWKADLGQQITETTMIPEFTTLPRPRGTAADILEAKGSQVYSVTPGASVFDAVVLMNEHEVGALLVMEGPALRGIMSERDYTRKVAIQGRSSRETAVHEIMTSELYTVKPATTLAECMHIVTRHGVRHLPVLNGSTVVGVISIGDLVSALLAYQAETIDRLNSFVTGGYPS